MIKVQQSGIACMILHVFKAAPENHGNICLNYLNHLPESHASRKQDAFHGWNNQSECPEIELPHPDAQ